MLARFGKRDRRAAASRPSCPSDAVNVGLSVACTS